MHLFYNWLCVCGPLMQKMHKWLKCVVHLEQIWLRRGVLGAVLARACAGFTRSAGTRAVLEARAVLDARACWGQRVQSRVLVPALSEGPPQNFQLARAGIQLGF